MSPQQGDLRDLLAKRSEVEKYLGLYEQAKSFEAMIRKISDETDAEVATAVAGLGLTAVREFSTEISKRLAEWTTRALTPSDTFGTNWTLSREQQQSVHGKGVRAILHAAFTLALAQYCFDRELPHAGFVVLDSPLVTYRPPDQSTETDEEPPEGVVRAFYRDIEENFDGQVIVMENTDPLEPLGSEALDVPFAKLTDVGRYGFLPAVVAEVKPEFLPLDE